MNNFLSKFGQFAKKNVCILQDDYSPVSRAVLVAPAEKITLTQLNEMLTLSKGNVFVALAQTRAEAFMLPPMQRAQGSLPTTTNGALVSVDAREGISTGISVADRVRAISILTAKVPQPRALVKPGHIFPIAVRHGGTLVRHALPEGAYDLVAKLDGVDVAVYLDLLDDNGNLLSAAQQEKLSRAEGIPLLAMSDLVQYRLQVEPLVYRVAEANLPTREAGELKSIVYKSHLHEGEHMALVKGEICSEKINLVRVQAEHTFSDVFGGAKNSSRDSLNKALQILKAEESGVLLYLRKPERGALYSQLNQKSSGSLAMSSLMREYGLGAQILRDIGVRRIKLLSNNSQKLLGLQTFGIEIVDHMDIFK